MAKAALRCRVLAVLWSEVRYAARGMLRAPGVPAAVVVTLALGIGASTGVFSVVYGVLLRPLPYGDGERLAVIRMERTVEGVERPARAFFPLDALPELQSRTQSFEAIAFYSTEEKTVSHSGFGEHVTAAAVSPEFFATVDGPFRAGRGLSEGDAAAVVISERLQRRVFGNQDALGRTLTIGSRPYEIVGVVDPAFRIPSPSTDVWIPAVQGGCCPYAALARLRVSVPLSQAALDVGRILPSLSKQDPRVYGGARAAVTSLRAELVGDVRRPLWILLAAVALLLAVSCANATTLLIGRHAARARETTIRIAIGASPGRLVAQGCAEAAIAVSIAGWLGLLLATILVAGVTWLDPAGMPHLGATGLQVDRAAVLFAAGVATAVTIVIGLLPALAARRTGTAVMIDGPGMTTGRARRRIDNALVIVQLAVSVTLLVGAALLARSFERLITTDLGVRSAGVATAAINLTYERHLSDAQQAALVERILARVRAQPNVHAAGAGAALPPHATTVRLTLKRFGDTVDYEAAGVPATPGYFAALGVRLLAGRFFSDADGLRQPPVMIMTADTARRFFGGGDPIGRTMMLPVLRDGTAASEEVTLVGVISNIKYSGLEAAPDDAVYRPLQQQAWPLLFVVARTSGDARVLAATLRQEIAAIDPAIAMSWIGALSDIVASEAAPPRFRSAVLAALAVFTLAIAVVGLYAVVARGVSQRTREFGVRIALGARGIDLLVLILGPAAGLAAAGLGAGIVGSLLVTRVLRGVLYGIEPTDGLSFIAASGVLLVAAAAASYIPARRAARLDPIRVLRVE
jgi:predicted permease